MAQPRHETITANIISPTSFLVLSCYNSLSDYCVSLYGIHPHIYSASFTYLIIRHANLCMKVKEVLEINSCTCLSWSSGL
jgi:hypothetical protein